MSEDEVKKAMLECGYETPFEAGGMANNNDVALMQLCMEKSGFIYDERVKTFCVHYAYLEACQARNYSEVPVRDPKRRLNGFYCKNTNYSNFPVCK